MKQLIKTLIKYQASDLHLKVGRPPLYRVHGRLLPAKMPDLTQTLLEKTLAEVMSENLWQTLTSAKQVDFGFEIETLGRFRANVYFQKGTLAASVRRIPSQIPALESLGIPSIVKELAEKPRGLFLVTGATGTGKSTTLASLIQYLNNKYQKHILVIEDPIEFVHTDQKSSITQREVGLDTRSMAEALRSGLRQDPDVIVIGELRDRETIEVALAAAETGHLVISTLHTNDAKSSVDRIIEVFSHEAQNQIRLQLAASLVGVVSQMLIKLRDAEGRILVCEVLVKSPMVEDLIRKGQTDKIPEVMARSADYYQMQTRNQVLEKLILSGQISEEEGLRYSPSPDDLKLRLQGFSHAYDSKNQVGEVTDPSGAIPELELSPPRKAV